jgi:hypothetical protein
VNVDFPVFISQGPPDGISTALPADMQIFNRTGLISQLLAYSPANTGTADLSPS